MLRLRLAAASSASACASAVVRTRAPAAAARALSTHPDFQPRIKMPAPSAGAAAPAGADAERIKGILAGHPVVLFMKGSPAQPQCGFSAQAVRVLTQNSVAIHGVDVLKDAALRQTMKDFSQWPTFPQLYVKGEFVGGCDIMTQMQGSGELATLLKDVPKLA